MIRRILGLLFPARDRGEFVSADCRRHWARLEMSQGVDLPYWPAQKRGAKPFWDRQSPRLRVVAREKRA
jgi:hypothetical protein